MGKTYYVNLNIDDATLKDRAIEQLLQTAFIDQLMIIEDKPDLAENMSYNLIIFDSVSSEEEIIDYCKRELLNSPKAIFIHLSESDAIRNDDVHLVGVSKELFSEYFIHLIGMCFLTHTVRESVNDIQTLLSVPERG